MILKIMATLFRRLELPESLKTFGKLRRTDLHMYENSKLALTK